MAGSIYTSRPERMVRPGRMAPEGQRNVTWNNLKKVLRAVDDRVTENACERGRRWVPEREAEAAARPAAARRTAAPKSLKAALAR